MNVLGSFIRIKCASNSMIKNIAQGTRNYAAFKKLPVEWVCPTVPSCISKERSGDGGLDYNIPSDSYTITGQKVAPLLDKENELVRKIFSVNFQRRKELVKLQKECAKDSVKRHQYDRQSLECKIAETTAEILQLQDHQVLHNRNKKSKVFLKELIEKRKKWLKNLRKYDYRRFEYLLERLNLVYHPFPEGPKFLSRKVSTKHLLQKWCDNVVQTKLDAYKAELKNQQKDFFREKAEKLEFMRNEEIDCGVSPTITLEEIEAAKQKAASFV